MTTTGTGVNREALADWYRRNRERYVFLRWGQKALRNFRVVPPETGIVHQVNVEYLARVVFHGAGEPPLAYPDTLVGTDSHTTMVNGLGVLGWGVGGIEAEAAMLGQPVSMLIPQVVGMRLSGELPEGATATDLVLRVTELLRQHGVVGKFVEFFGPGLERLPLADRGTIANMAPEYGATCGIFPIGEETLKYLRFTGRAEAHVQLVEAYARAQGLFHTADAPEPEFTDRLELDLSNVEPAVAGPRRPQDRVALRDVKRSFLAALEQMIADYCPGKCSLLPSRFVRAGGLLFFVANGGVWRSDGTRYRRVVPGAHRAGGQTGPGRERGHRAQSGRARDRRGTRRRAQSGGAAGTVGVVEPAMDCSPAPAGLAFVALTRAASRPCSCINPPIVDLTSTV